MTRRRDRRLRIKVNAIRRDLGPWFYQDHRWRMRRSRIIAYRDRQGRPLNAHAWAVLHNMLRYKRVAVTRLTTPQGEPVRVSTVWLGLDMGVYEQPQIFETMVLTDDETYRSVGDLCWRYGDEPTARIGHELAVGYVREGKALVDDEVPA
jgi:hypothetical protein